MSLPDVTLCWSILFFLEKFVLGAICLGALVDL
jgi:hypothetical protein